jgi:hypothetical protein
MLSVGGESLATLGRFFAPHRLSAPVDWQLRIPKTRASGLPNGAVPEPQGSRLAGRRSTRQSIPNSQTGVTPGEFATNSEALKDGSPENAAQSRSLNNLPSTGRTAPLTLPGQLIFKMAGARSSVRPPPPDMVGVAANRPMIDGGPLGRTLTQAVGIPAARPPLPSDRQGPVGSRMQPQHLPSDRVPAPAPQAKRACDKGATGASRAISPLVASSAGSGQMWSRTPRQFAPFTINAGGEPASHGGQSPSAGETTVAAGGRIFGGQMGATHHVSASEPSGQQGTAAIQGDVYLDGTLMGKWVARTLAREAGRPPAGGPGFDARRSALPVGRMIGS